ncbi:hypothetical protein P7C73_g6463, partial [Tremellales sp. Uapishka_1]
MVAALAPALRRSFPGPSPSSTKGLMLPPPVPVRKVLLLGTDQSGKRMETELPSRVLAQQLPQQSTRGRGRSRSQDRATPLDDVENPTTSITFRRLSMPPPRARSVTPKKEIAAAQKSNVQPSVDDRPRSRSRSQTPSRRRKQDTPFIDDVENPTTKIVFRKLPPSASRSASRSRSRSVSVSAARRPATSSPNKKVDVSGVKVVVEDADWLMEEM